MVVVVGDTDTSMDIVMDMSMDMDLVMAMATALTTMLIPSSSRLVRFSLIFPRSGRSSGIH
jgi:hypothetical protein